MRREQRVGDFLTETASKGLEKAQSCARHLKEFLVYPLQKAHGLWNSTEENPTIVSFRAGAAVLALFPVFMGGYSYFMTGEPLRSVVFGAGMYLFEAGLFALVRPALEQSNTPPRS